MDYKEKYDKLVEAVKVLQEENPSDEGIQNWVNDNVPELTESKDERIRKELIKETKGSEVRLFEIVTNGEFIAWLEKKKQKSAWSEEDKEMYQNIHECLKNGWKKLPTDLLKCESWFKSLKQRIEEES